jgi:hypothetical protein
LRRTGVRIKRKVENKERKKRGIHKQGRLRRKEG